MKFCLYCGNEIPEFKVNKRFRRDKKYCNQKCHDKHKYEKESESVKEFRDSYGLNKYTLRGLEKKLQLIELFGGKCEICGYDKNISAFDFHHVNPDDKKFEVKVQWLKSASEEDILEEAMKCMLLCSNCHRELHNPSHSINHVKKVLEIENKLDS